MRVGCRVLEMPVIEERVRRLRDRMAAEKVPAMLVQNPLNVGYLSGFTGSTAVLIVTPERRVFITDSRYAIQAARECSGWELAIIQSSAGYSAKIAEQIKALDLTAIAVEADHLTLAGLEGLQKKLEGVELKPTAEIVTPLRQIKDASELRVMREACAIADRAFEFALTLLRPGVSERDVMLDLNYWIARNGADREGFDTIVLSGARTSLPHGHPSEKRLERGDLITMDFGARLDGYTSDITRTVVLGSATERQREVYGVVLEANRAGIAAMRPGAEGKAVDSAARDLITARGYGEHFGHGLGHGLGRHVHDHVALGQTSELTLAAGMVITVEPGIYIEGWGGIRIEDDVLVTETGREVLTHAPKELIELPLSPSQF